MRKLSYISKFTVSCLALYEEANLTGGKKDILRVCVCVRVQSVYEHFFN